MPQDMFTVQDVATFLNISEKGVRRLIKRRRLKAIRIGGVYRIPRGEVCRLRCPSSPRRCDVNRGPVCELTNVVRQWPHLSK